jgi:hypothetical protein
MYENKIFKRDTCDEVSLLHPHHRFAKTRTRRGIVKVLIKLQKK